MKNKEIYIVLMLLIQSVIIFIPVDVVSAADPYGGNIVGDTVYWENNYANLSVYPHTSTNILRQQQWANLTWKETDNTIDVAFRFNDSLSYGRIWRWNGASWVPVSMSHTTYNNMHYYYYQGFNVVQDTTYRFRWEFDTPVNSSGKWDLFAKLNQHTIQQALANDWYVMLDPWWNSSYNHRRDFTISNTYIDTDLDNFPVLVNVSAIVSAYCDGGDSIRFVDEDNTTEYYYEIEGTWNPSSYNFVWVNITSISSTADTTFHMYYNNSAVSDNQNPTDVWNSGYIHVWHMNGSSDTQIWDSTETNHSASASCNAVDGMIGGARDFVEVDNDSVSFGDMATPSNSVINTGTFEFYYETHQVADYCEIISKYDGDSQERGYSIVKNTDGTMGGTLMDSSARYWGWTTDNQIFYDNTYVFATVVVNASTETMVMYADGESEAVTKTSNVGTGPTVFANQASSDRLMYYDPSGADSTDDGVLDEIRISQVYRNASWVKATYHSNNQTSGFMSEVAGLNMSLIDYSPTTGSIDQNTSVVVNVTLEQRFGNNYDICWYTNVSGSWVMFAKDTGCTNGTYTQTNSSWNSFDTWYYWRVYADDGVGNFTWGIWSFQIYGIPDNPTNLNGDAGTGYLNISWVNSTDGRTDNVTILYKSSSYPTSPTDGTVIYNSSTPYYNDTTYYSGYYTLFAYNSTIGYYSTGVNLGWGSLTINVYDETDGSAITGWDVFITNQNGSQTYESLGNNNPLTINIDVLPVGNNVAIKLNATNYNFSLFYMTLVQNTAYTLNAHLTPESESELYLLTVLNEIDVPVEEATMNIQRYINDSVGFESVGIYLTDANGQVSTYLVPYELYKFTISLTGYITEIADWTPDPDIRIKTFRMSSVTSEPVEFTIFWDNITFTGTMDSGGNITITYDDNSLLTTNSQVYLYESYNGTDTLIDSKSYGGVDSYSYIVLGCNNSRLHYAYLFLNHSYDFAIDYPVVEYIQPTNRTFEPHTVADLENAFTQVFGTNPLGWGNSIAFAVAIIILCSFAPFDIGAGIISAFISLIGVQLAFVLNPVLIIIVPIGIAIGMFYMFANRQAEDYT